jgi:predicted nucleic acid-binding protein
LTPSYVDTNVFAYALGTPHRYRDPCRRVVELIVARALAGEISVEVLQELAHLRRRRGLSDATRRAREVAAFCADVHEVQRRDLDGALALMDRHRELPGRDAVHAAIAVNRGITTIVSADRHFDRLDEIRRVDPIDVNAVRALTAPT